MDDMRQYWRVLASVTKRPVILQTIGGVASKGPVPSTQLLIELAREFQTMVSRHYGPGRTVPASPISSELTLTKDEIVERLNGWQKTISAGDSAQDSLLPGTTRLDVARAMKGKNELVWETQPVPKDARTKPEYTLAWRGGMGYFVEPHGSFTFYVDGERAIDIPAISRQDAVWHNADNTVRLNYVRDTTTDEYGTLTLTIPSARVTPGRPLRLRVVGSDSNSRRWFGVFQTW